MESILITGVSSGTGLGLTEKFIAEGFQVIGSVRTEQQSSELQARFGSNFVPLIFDVTKADQIASASRKLKHELGVDYLSGIINNAGSAKIGPLLHVPIQEFQEHLDILVVGQLSVIQNFYKFLIPGSNNHAVGRIFNISSVSGTGSNYLFGCYASAKHALEGLSKTLREECRMYGINVITVAPGNIATAIWDKQTDDMAEKYRDTDYYHLVKNKIGGMDSEFMRQALSVEEFSDAFYGIFKDASPADRYTVIKSGKKRLPFGGTKVKVLRY